MLALTGAVMSAQRDRSGISTCNTNRSTGLATLVHVNGQWRWWRVPAAMRSPATGFATRKKIMTSHMTTRRITPAITAITAVTLLFATACRDVDVATSPLGDLNGALRPRNAISTSTCPYGGTAITVNGTAACQVVFTSSGSFAAPSLEQLSAFDVLTVGGGGGGGGGGPVTNKAGGGGGGGEVVVCEWPSINYGSTVSVTVGAAGAAGDAQGGDGASGDYSRIENECEASGGQGALGTTRIVNIFYTVAQLVSGGSSGSGNLGGETRCDILNAGGGGGDSHIGQTGYEPNGSYDCYGGFGGAGTVPTTGLFANNTTRYGAGGGGAGLCGGGLGGAFDATGQLSSAGAGAGSGGSGDGGGQCTAVFALPTSASANTGSGGGGAWSGISGAASEGYAGGAGGSGYVVIRYVPAGGGGGGGTCDLTGVVTRSQGGWGSKNSPLLSSGWFATNFPSNLVIGGSARSATFTSGNAVHNFLPQSGTPAILPGTSTNPSRNLKNTLAGQATALTLNLAANPGIGGAKFSATSSYSGTVSDLLKDANASLDGTGITTKSMLTKLTDLMASVNTSFDGGKDRGVLTCSI